MSENYAVKITVKGKVIMLYEDERKGLIEGNMSIKRASNVRFNDKSKMWEVFKCHEDGTETRIGGAYSLRRDAIKAEITILNELLATGELIDDSPKEIL